MIGLQIFGLIFGLGMLFLTYFYFRRNQFTVPDMTLWGMVWFGFIYAVLFPGTLDIFIQTFRIQGAMHLFTIAGFMFLFAVVFFMYKTIRRTEKRMEKLVQNLALQKVRKR